MKKLSLIIILLTFTLGSNAQKVKLKKGTVYVNKKEYLTYKSDTFYSLKGVPLFTLEKKTTEKQNPNKINVQQSNNDVERRFNELNNSGDPLRRGNRYAKLKKVKYVKVSFLNFKLEYETSLKKSKIIRAFYKNDIVNVAGTIDQDAANRIASKISKEISKKDRN